MKEIGEKLRETRENIGISIEEAAEDLKLEPSQIESIENGNTETFQDVFNLKYFIRDYAKYLGLDKDSLIDDFNEYLFDYTSKLSLDDIKKETKRKKEAEHKICSPYTVERKSERTRQIIISISLLVLLAIICYLLYVIATDKNEDNNDNLVYGGIYEFTK